MIRTADALWYDVVISWYTPHPHIHPKVQKTSLWSQDAVTIETFLDPLTSVPVLQSRGYTVIACELTASSIDIRSVSIDQWPYALIVGNEVTWVLQETLEAVDYTAHIPMLGVKESLNVAQAAAICMREANKRSHENE